MSDRSKVPPPPWASKADARRTKDLGRPAGGAAGDEASTGKEAVAWPSLDDLAGNGTARRETGDTPPAEGPGRSSASRESPRPSQAPGPEPIPLDLSTSPEGPQSPYGSVDDGPPEPPQRLASSQSPSATADATAPPVRRAPKPGAGAAASGIIRSKATPMWRIVVVRFVIPLVLILVFITGYRFWATKSAFKAQVTHDMIMGFDANILDGVEELVARDGYKLGTDGVQGWILGTERRWIVSVHVRNRAFVVVPYYVHYVFDGDLPYNSHVDTHLLHFTEDQRWAFDEAMIQAYVNLDPDRVTLAEEVAALRARSPPPPR